MSVTTTLHESQFIPESYYTECDFQFKTDLWSQLEELECPDFEKTPYCQIEEEEKTFPHLTLFFEEPRKTKNLCSASAELLDLTDIQPRTFEAPDFQPSSLIRNDSSDDSPINSPSQSPTKSPKKRQRISPEQLSILEEVYRQKKSPDPNLRNQLAEQLQMTPRRVQIWFQNKRAREKRHKEPLSPFASSLFNIKVVKYCVHS